MKKVFLLFAAFLLLSIPTQAWKWGVEGGIDLSRFKASKGMMSNDNRIGWFVGMKIKGGLVLPNLGYDVALLYNQNKIVYVKSGVEHGKKLHMFVIPLNMRYNYEINDKFGVYLASGPQWNWFVGKSNIGGMGEMKHSFFDWNVGAGFDVLGHVQLGFNYNIPLGKMGSVNNVDIEGRTWNFRFAYFF